MPPASNARRGQCAQAHGRPWNTKTCARADENGHLEVLKLALARGFPWDKRKYASAAKNMHLEVPQWAQAHKCLWGDKTCAWAAKNTHLIVNKRPSVFAGPQAPLETKNQRVCCHERLLRRPPS